MTADEIKDNDAKGPIDRSLDTGGHNVDNLDSLRLGVAAPIADQGIPLSQFGRFEVPVAREAALAMLAGPVDSNPVGKALKTSDPDQLFQIAAKMRGTPAAVQGFAKEIHEKA